MPRTTRSTRPPRARPVILPRKLPARSPRLTARDRSLLRGSQLRASATAPLTRVRPHRSAPHGSVARGVRRLCRATTRPANRVRSPALRAANCSWRLVTQHRLSRHHRVPKAQPQLMLPRPLALCPPPAHGHPTARRWACPRTVCQYRTRLSRPQPHRRRLARPVAPGGGRPVQKRGQNRDSNGGTGG